MSTTCFFFSIFCFAQSLEQSWLLLCIIFLTIFQNKSTKEKESFWHSFFGSDNNLVLVALITISSTTTGHNYITTLFQNENRPTNHKNISGMRCYKGETHSGLKINFLYRKVSSLYNYSIFKRTTKRS